MLPLLITMPADAVMIDAVTFRYRVYAFSLLTPAQVTLSRFCSYFAVRCFILFLLLRCVCCRRALILMLPMLRHFRLPAIISAFFRRHMPPFSKMAMLISAIMILAWLRLITLYQITLLPLSRCHAAAASFIVFMRLIRLPRRCCFRHYTPLAR